MEIADALGWLGTALILTAYAPQIGHLIKEKCTAGLSMISWHLWLAGSVLLFVHAYARNDAVVMAVQGVNALAVIITLYVAHRYRANVCTHCAQRHGQP